MRIKNLFFTAFIITSSIFITRTEAQQSASLSQIRLQELNSTLHDSVGTQASLLDFEKSCSKARKLKKSGSILLTISSISIPVGTVVAISGFSRFIHDFEDEKAKNKAQIGVGFVAAGMTIFLIGAPIYIIGSFKMKRIGCNGKPNLKLGSSSHGVGLQLTF